MSVYHCCACDEPIGWFQGMTAAAWTAHRCAACGVEQHRADLRWPAFLAMIALGLLVFLAFFLLLVRGAPVLLAASPILVLALLAAAYERRRWQDGALVRTDAAEKHRNRWVIGGVLAVLAVAWAVVEWAY